MQRESRKYLQDALTAVDRIARFISGKTFEAYGQDEQLRSAVERQFMIVGEALAEERRRDSGEDCRPAADRGIPQCHYSRLCDS